MFLGFSEELKPLRQELKSVGADMNTVKDWIKVYEKVKNTYPKVKKTYDTEREKLIQLQNILKHMEESFVAGGNVKIGLQDDVKQLKAMDAFLGHEFLVDKGNTEFELTFSRLKKMMLTLDKVSEKEMLFLHSETENLSHMIKEVLEKEVPNLRAFAFFIMNQNESQLREFPHEEKVKKIQRIYEANFLKPMETILFAAMDKADAGTPILYANRDKTKEERIHYILEDWIWN